MGRLRASGPIVPAAGAPLDAAPSRRKKTPRDTVRKRPRPGPIAVTLTTACKASPSAWASSGRGSHGYHRRSRWLRPSEPGDQHSLGRVARVDADANDIVRDNARRDQWLSVSSVMIGRRSAEASLPPVIYNHRGVMTLDAE